MFIRHARTRSTHPSSEHVRGQAQLFLQCVDGRNGPMSMKHVEEGTLKSSFTGRAATKFFGLRLVWRAEQLRVLALADKLFQSKA